MIRHVRLASVPAFLLVLLLPSSTLAYGMDIWNGSWANEWPQNYTCVAASSVTWVNYIDGGTNYSNARVVAYYNAGRPHDKYSYPGTGMDPRGWAWLMWKYTPAGWGFNDYWYGGTYGQATADSELEMGIRTTYSAVGALVDKGNHAFLLNGFSATADPLNYPSTLRGFYVIDPWYDGVHNKDWTGYNGAQYNLKPNSYIAIATWNADYFLPYHESSQKVIWEGDYVDVLRASGTGVNPPSDTPPATYADTYGGDAPIGEPAPPKDPGFGSIPQATTQGIASNLLSRDNGLGVPLAGAVAGPAVHVTSDDAAFPSYELVELSEGGRPVAVAMLTDLADGYHFAGVQLVAAGFQMLNASGARAFFATRGFNARSVALQWAFSMNSPSPYAPSWVASDGLGHLVTTEASGALIDLGTTTAGQAGR